LPNAGKPVYHQILAVKGSENFEVRTISRKDWKKFQNPQRLYARRFQINNWSRRFENDDIVRPLWRHKVNTFLVLFGKQ